MAHQWPHLVPIAIPGDSHTHTVWYLISDSPFFLHHAVLMFMFLPIARQATEQIQDLQMMLASMGVPMQTQSVLLGDNQSIVTQSTVPHSTLSKRWNALSYHKVQLAISGGYLRFCHIRSEQNPADILTKYLGYSDAFPLLQPLLFWSGEMGRASS